MTEPLGLIGVVAALLGLALVVYGFFYNRRANRALIERIQQDINAAQQRVGTVRSDMRAGRNERMPDRE